MSAAAERVQVAQRSNRVLDEALAVEIKRAQIEEGLGPAEAELAGRKWLHELCAVPQLHVEWSMMGHHVVWCPALRSAVMDKGYRLDDLQWEAWTPIFAAAPSMLATLNGLLKDLEEGPLTTEKRVKWKAHMRNLVDQAERFLPLSPEAPP